MSKIYNFNFHEFVTNFSISSFIFAPYFETKYSRMDQVTFVEDNL